MKSNKWWINDKSLKMKSIDGPKNILSSKMNTENLIVSLIELQKSQN